MTELTVTNKRKRNHVLAIGYQADDGTIVVTEVLCANFPDLTKDEIGSLSRKTEELSMAWKRQNKA